MRGSELIPLEKRNNLRLEKEHRLVQLNRVADADA